MMKRKPSRISKRTRKQSGVRLKQHARSNSRSQAVHPSVGGNVRRLWVYEMREGEGYPWVPQDLMTDYILGRTLGKGTISMPEVRFVRGDAYDE